MTAQYNESVLVKVCRIAEDPGRHEETAHYQTWRDTVPGMMTEPGYSVKCDNTFRFLEPLFSDETLAVELNLTSIVFCNSGPLMVLGKLIRFPQAVERIDNYLCGQCLS